MAEKHDLKVYPKHNVELAPDPDGTMHDSRGGTFSRFFRHKVRSWPTATHGQPVVHESVNRRTRNPQNESTPPYKPWILDETYEPEIEPWIEGGAGG